MLCTVGSQSAAPPTKEFRHADQHPSARDCRSHRGNGSISLIERVVYVNAANDAESFLQVVDNDMGTATPWDDEIALTLST